MGKKLYIGAGAALVVTIEILRRSLRKKGQQNLQEKVTKTAPLRRSFRKKGQKDLQEKVDQSAPKPTVKDSTVESEHVQISVKKGCHNVDFVRCQEINITKEELDEWKSFLSLSGGEVIKAALAANAFNGLVECNVPLKDLCRVNGNPDLLRGYAMHDGKIGEHAKFKEVGISSAAPLLIFQCMAVVTSQYYQQIIIERLNDIDAKLNELLNILDADKKAKLIVAYRHLLDLSKKSEFDIADKAEVLTFTREVEELRESYKIQLSKIKDLDLNDFAATDKKEAELKIKKLQDSDYFNKLEMAMQAEALCFIAYAVSVKVAIYLGKKEDAQNYAKKMNLDFWSNYEDQFNMIKHDVLKYLELQANSAWFQEDSIKAMRDDMDKKFGEVESRMLKLQNQFDRKTKLYIKFQEDGTAKSYVRIEESIE